MTKLRNLILLAVCGCAFATRAATPGSAEAAGETAVEAAAMALSAAAAPAKVQGDAATVRVVVGGVECSVQLQRDARGPKGWLVTKLDCPARK